MGRGQGSGLVAGASVKLPVVLRPEAQSEFDEAFDWYEARRPGLGVEFVGEIEALLTRVSDAPERYQVVYREVRHAVSHRFPYAVLFKVESHQIVVLAVFHSKRNPHRWQTRA